MTPEQEIKYLKSLIYCTEKSCNNCGKVECENFQRQRKDCCELWVSFKDYILDLKANFDLAIEGRDLKIEELELELTVEKDLHQEETNLHLQAEEYIKSLEQQIEKMKVCSNCKHFNKAEDNEYCWNCERHLVNSLDNLKAEEIIKDEWELKND